MNRFELTDGFGTTGVDPDATANRRQVMKMIAGLGAAALAAGVVGKTDTFAAATATQYKTTTNLNFRSGPGMSYKVIRVIPAGGIMAHTGAVKNSFFEVGYGGTYGWVHKDYLAPVGSSGDPVIVGSARTKANVNLRSGPSTGHQVLRVVAAGSVVKVSNTVRSGFRYVVHNGLAGWIADQYLGSGDDQGGNYRRATANLNLRAEPSTSSRVLLVIPAGAKVQLLHTAANGFANVNYGGKQGWAHLDYLK